MKNEDKVLEGIIDGLLNMGYTEEDIKDVLEKKNEVYSPVELEFLNNNDYGNPYKEDIYFKNIYSVEDKKPLMQIILNPVDYNKVLPFTTLIVRDKYDIEIGTINANQIYEELKKLKEYGFLDRE